MIVNGNLKFHTLGAGTLQNAIMENFTTAARDLLGPAERIKGRMIFNTTTDQYNYFNGTNNSAASATGWIVFGTGGSVTALQAEVDAIELASGGVFNTDGTYGGTAVDSALGNVTSSSDLLDALTQMDTAISNAAGVDTLPELTDVTITSAAINDFIVANGSGITYVNLNGAAARTAMGVSIGSQVQAYDAGLLSLAGLSASSGDVIYATAADTYAVAQPGTTSGVQAYDAALDALSAVTGTGFIVQTAADTFITTALAASAVAGDQGISITDPSGIGDAPVIGLDILGLTAEAGTLADTDVFAMYDGTNNVKATLADIRIGVLATGGIALDDLSDVVITAAASNEFIMFDGSNWVDTTPANARTGMDVYSKGEADTNFVDVAGDTMTGNLVMSAGTDVKLPDQPVLATDAANKAYVDTVAAGQQWKDAIIDPNLTAIVTAVPTAVADTGYLAYGGSYPQNWGTGATAVAEYDYVVRNAADTAWIVVENIDGKNSRFGVALESGTAAASLTGIGIVNSDLVEYVGGTGGDASIAASWSHPEGMNGTHTAVNVVSITVATDTVKISGDQTLHFFPGNRITLSSTTAHDGEYIIQSVTFNAPNTDIVTIEDLTGSDQAAVGTALSEIFDGVTVLTSDPESEHQGHSFLYQELSNVWVQVAGPGTVGAGIGLSYSGNVLNVNLGAGIVELPTDEVGVDVRTDGGIITTLDGTSSSTTTGAKLAILLDSTTLSLSTSGIKVATGGITNTEVNASAGIAFSKLEVMTSGNILVGSSGNVATEVTMSGDVTIDDLGATTIGAGKVLNSMLANDNLTIAADTGTSETANLGETLTLAGGTAIASVVSATNTVTMNYNGGLNDQSDVVIASEVSGDILVSDGTGFDNVGIQFIQNQTTSSTSWTVTHNLNQRFVNVTVYDSTFNVIIPQSIVATSTTVTTITFNTAISGTAVIMGVPGATVTTV